MGSITLPERLQQGAGKLSNSQRIIMRTNGLVLLSIAFATFVQTDALVIGRDGGDPEPDLVLYPAAVKRIFSSYYHNRNAPSSTKFSYPVLVRNPPKKQKLKNLKSTNSSSSLRNLM